LDEEKGIAKSFPHHPFAPHVNHFSNKENPNFNKDNKLHPTLYA